MPEKLKALLKKRYIGILLILPFLAFLVIFTWPLTAIFIIEPIMKFFYFFYLNWRILIIYAILGTIVAMFVGFILPYGKFILHKLRVYTSLRRACKRNKYKFNATRFSLGFGKEIRETEDIKITTQKGTYLIHLVGLVYPAKRFIQLEGEQYKFIKKKKNVIIESGPFGIPEFPADGDNKHIFMLLSPKTEFRIHKGSSINMIASNTEFKSMVFYYAEEFIQMLKR